MRNRVKLLLVFSCVLWIACCLFYRTQTIDASSKIPGRYTFTKIYDNYANYLSMNNEGTVAMNFFDNFSNSYNFLAIGDGRVSTELIKRGDIVFSEWEVGEFYNNTNSFGDTLFIDDKGLIWFYMNMCKVNDRRTGGSAICTIDSSKQLSKIDWLNHFITANNNETFLQYGATVLDIFTNRHGALTTIVDKNTISNMGYNKIWPFSLNDLGTVAFGCSVNTWLPQGIFMGNGGPLTQIAVTGTNINTDFKYVTEPCVNNSNIVSFRGRYYDGIEGIFVNIGGFVTPYFISPLYSSFHVIYAPSMNDHGTIVFLADRGAFGNNSPWGIFTGPDPVIDKVIASGDMLFGSKVTSCDIRWGIDSPPRMINNKGQVVFLANLEDGTSGVFRADPNPDYPHLGRVEDLNLGPPFDKNTGMGEPVNIASGNMYINKTDISNPAPGMPFEFVRTYNSADKQTGPLGWGWTHNFNITLMPPADNVSNAVVFEGTGRTLSFSQVGAGTFKPIAGEYSTLTKTADGFFWEKRDKTTYTFNANGNLQSIKDRNSNTILLSYDDKGRLATITDPVGRVYTLSYDDKNHITSIKDPANRAFAYEYDNKDNLIKVTDPVGVVSLYEYTAKYDPHKITRQTVGTFVYTYSYDTLGRCVVAVGSNGEVGYEFEYKPTEGKTVTTDSKGNVLTKYYNNGGKVTRIVYPDESEENFTWDDNFEKTAGTRQDGSAWHYEYDGNGNLTKMIDPQGCQKVMTYNVDNDLTSVVDELGNTTRYAYDGKGNLTTVTNADETVVSFTYNTRGQPLTTTDALGKTTTFSYDSNGNLVSTTDPTGNIVTYTHNALGLVTSKTNARGNTTSYEYDALNRVIKTTDPLNGEVNTTHKIAGLGSLTDQNSNTTSFSYDTLNQLTDVTDPLGKIHHVSYDAMGNLTSRTDFNQAVTVYTYNNVDKLTKVQYPGANQVAFVYDAVGRVTQMSDDTGGTSYSYDTVGRIISYTNGQGLSVGYAYDNAGNLTALTYPGGKTVNYTYDSLRRLTRVKDWAGRETTYSYDQRGLVTRVTLPNGTKTQYDYDDAGRMIGLKNLKGDDSVIASYTYTLDQNGNISAETVNQPLCLLMQPQSVNYTYGKDNRILRADSASFIYDQNGNLTKKGNAAYEYDYENRLKKVTTSQGTWEYDYDGVGNRVGLKVGGDTRRFLLDPTGMTKILAEYDGSGNLVANYVYGLGLVYKVDAADKPYYYHYNFTGSTVAMTDTSGNVVNKYAYAPFGRVAGSVESVPNLFRYAGKSGVVDDKNGLYYMRARYYDPEVGRFITKDPIGFDGGVNLYGYVENNPTNYIDPQGLSMSDSFGKLVWKVIVEAIVKPIVKPVIKKLAKEGAENMGADVVQQYVNKRDEGMNSNLCDKGHTDINPLTGQKYSEYRAPTPEEAERQKDIWVQIIEFLGPISSDAAY